MGISATFFVRSMSCAHIATLANANNLISLPSELMFAREGGRSHAARCMLSRWGVSMHTTAPSVEASPHGQNGSVEFHLHLSNILEFMPISVEEDMQQISYLHDEPLISGTHISVQRHALRLEQYRRNFNVRTSNHYSHPRSLLTCPPLHAWSLLFLFASSS